MNQALPHHVQRFVTHNSAPERRLGAFIRSNRFVLMAAIVLAIILPELFHPIVARSYGWAIYAHDMTGMLASLASLTLAHFGLQRISAVPLVDDKITIAPAFFVSYAITIFIVSFAFMDFGRYHFLTSFVIGVAWYYAIAIARARITAPRLAYVGLCNPDDDLLASQIEWMPLYEANLPQDVLGIVFDKRQTLSPAFERLFARAVLRGIPVYEAGYLREMVTGRVQLHIRPEEEFGALFPSQPYLRIKRLFDTAVAIPAALLVAPVIAAFAVLIRLESPGPAIFRQVRIGYQGRRFVCYKLRSMRSDVAGPDYTSEHDPRVTRIGRFIRKTRIDELPQIFNILKGEMCWIGPRPEALNLARSYDRDIPYYGYRHLVRPGITGWAAVHQGNVALLDAATRKLEYDFFYIKHFSPWLDMLIALMTVRTVLTGFGSR